MRKVIAITLVLCIAALCAACAGPTKNEDFTGVWQRTNVERSMRAQIEITEQTDTQFRFSIDAVWEAHTGGTDGVALFTAPNRAEWHIAVDFADHTDEGTLTFTLDGENLIVSYEGVWMALGFGTNVEPDGVYTKDEPAYTNANIVHDIFPTEEIRANMVALLGEEEFAYITRVMEYGSGWDNREMFTYSGFISGAGMGVDLILEGSKIYCLVFHSETDVAYIFYTNDPLYRDQLPDAFALSRNKDVPITFVCVE
ncbi:MAG: hypothetical protein FWF10_01960 [Clostridiales bacterium]|nr:hypothetical protein [Clostridiales bacterium]